MDLQVRIVSSTSQYPERQRGDPKLNTRSQIKRTLRSPRWRSGYWDVELTIRTCKSMERTFEATRLW